MGVCYLAMDSGSLGCFGSVDAATPPYGLQGPYADLHVAGDNWCARKQDGGVDW